MSSDRARIAVVGTGWWSTSTHIPGLLDNPHAELIAICDTNEDRLSKAAEAFPGPATYTDVHELLRQEDLDGIIVAVVHSAHHSVAAACLDAGLHVMLEKPMTLTATDACDLVDRAAGQGRELIIGYPWHFTRTARRAREAITSGDLGEPQHVVNTYSSTIIEFLRGNAEAYRPVFDWKVVGPDKVYNDPRLTGGGEGHLQITHSSGLMFFVSGLRAERVSAVMNNYDVPMDLVDAMSVRFEGGAVGVVAGTGNMPVGDSGQLDIRVYCENGYVLLDAINGHLTITRHNGPKEDVRIIGGGDDTYPRFETSKNLVDVCVGRAPNGSPGAFGLRSVELLDAAYRSAAAGGDAVAVQDLYA
jgi:predicted dehydrogenase